MKTDPIISVGCTGKKNLKDLNPQYTHLAAELKTTCLFPYLYIKCNYFYTNYNPFDMVTGSVINLQQKKKKMNS
jgi:hypothetical protein